MLWSGLSANISSSRSHIDCIGLTASPGGHIQVGLLATSQGKSSNDSQSESSVSQLLNDSHEDQAEYTQEDSYFADEGFDDNQEPQVSNSD